MRSAEVMHASRKRIGTYVRLRPRHRLGCELADQRRCRSRHTVTSSARDSLHQLGTGSGGLRRAGILFGTGPPLTKRCFGD